MPTTQERRKRLTVAWRRVSLCGRRSSVGRVEGGALAATPRVPIRVETLRPGASMSGACGVSAGLHSPLQAAVERRPLLVQRPDVRAGLDERARRDDVPPADGDVQRRRALAGGGARARLEEAAHGLRVAALRRQLQGEEARGARRAHIRPAGGEQPHHGDLGGRRARGAAPSRAHTAAAQAERRESTSDGRTPNHDDGRRLFLQRVLSEKAPDLAQKPALRRQLVVSESVLSFARRQCPERQSSINERLHHPCLRHVSCCASRCVCAARGPLILLLVSAVHAPSARCIGRAICIANYGVPTQIGSSWPRLRQMSVGRLRP